MVEPMFRADLSSVSEGTFTLTGTEAKHAANVRRMRVGESIQVADGAGKRLRGSVAKVESGEVVIQVNSLAQETEPRVQLTLVQALAKGDRDELAIQAASELGVMRVIPWQAENSVSRWDAAKAKKGQERWQSIVIEAAKQALRSFDPVVEPLHSTPQLLQNLTGQRLVLDPTASTTLKQLGTFGPEVSLVVGPEGGISEKELVAFENAGFVRVRLGAEILRTSTAGISTISAIAAVAGLWD
ncbi:MAG: hypothetical protein RL670_851 [Actinomycetota bacterium]